MKGNFEHNIKTSLDSFEPEFNPADWADMNGRLDAAKGKGKGTSNLGKGLLIAASVAAVAGLIYYFSTTSDTSKDTEKTVVENISSDNQTAEQYPVQPEASKDQSSVKENTSADNASTAANNSSSQNTTEANKSVAPQKKDAPAVVNNTVVQNNNSNHQPVQTPVEQSSASASAVSAAFRSDINKVCEGMPVQFTVENTEVPCTYKWIFGDGETSTEQNPKHTFASAGNKTVRLKVTSVKDKRSDEQKNNILVIAAPSVDMSAKADDDNKLTIRFDASADKGVDLKWEFGDKKTGSGENPEHTYAKFGTYKVILTAKNSSGCTTSIPKDIKVENIIKLYAPNAFSPDGDNLNDTWIPTMDEEYAVTITIYDVRGGVVYTTSDKTPWDGTNSKTGDKVKSGEEFKWVAIIKDKTGNISKDKGDIMIK